MTWITLELGYTSAPYSRADAERPERHSHAERRNDHHPTPIVPMLRAHRYTQVCLNTDRAHRSAWACRSGRSASALEYGADSVSRAHDVSNWSLGTHLRHIQERTRSVLSGIPTRSVGTIITRRRSCPCSALIVIHKSASTLIVPIAPRGHASRDAPRHKWHGLRIQ